MKVWIHMSNSRSIIGIWDRRPTDEEMNHAYSHFIANEHREKFELFNVQDTLLNTWVEDHDVIYRTVSRRDDLDKPFNDVDIAHLDQYLDTIERITNANPGPSDPDDPASVEYWGKYGQRTWRYRDQGRSGGQVYGVSLHHVAQTDDADVGNFIAETPSIIRRLILTIKSMKRAE